MTRTTWLCTVVLALASSVEGMELRAVSPAAEAATPRCGVVVVNPAYVPPADGAATCIVPAIPADATRLLWVATELWEMPPAGSPAGWTRLTCGAVKWGNEPWSFSCFDAGVIEQYEGRRMAGTFTGTAAQLDATVRAWWAAQR